MKINVMNGGEITKQQPLYFNMAVTSYKYLGY